MLVPRAEDPKNDGFEALTSLRAEKVLWEYPHNNLVNKRVDPIHSATFPTRTASSQNCNGMVYISVHGFGGDVHCTDWKEM